ncbi:uncharacterized protein VDAG_05101 [Verticillium dahliae VdLs.17]|uniref:AB hydrolase-1 domain-containing protein n=1 Tax=Verticillium dahliae (strain VdLs.17 / ATCC MYA-4575 / FGSC 10137) TaxID=498257 RepID=G2X4L9_VERDV|nr:uncharacterized protein VDAG_05101 [Verticillium dahliae VdLs.17]EGY23663.1 hypothetical protein VDAG_05101 [Verticillium dahliae VdLs.17]
MAHPVKEFRLPTIVFIPGAWHGPWAFDTVRKNLESHGYPGSATTLASLANLDSDGGMYEDAASIRTELEGLIERGNEVVVVAHLGKQWRRGNIRVLGLVRPYLLECASKMMLAAAILTGRTSLMASHHLSERWDKSAFETSQRLQVGYTFTEKSQAIAVEAQRGMVSQFPAGSFTINLNTSHSPFLIGNEMDLSN